MGIDSVSHEIFMSPIPGKPRFMLCIHTSDGFRNVMATGTDTDSVATEAELLGKQRGLRVDALATVLLASYIPPAIEVQL